MRHALTLFGIAVILITAGALPAGAPQQQDPDAPRAQDPSAPVRVGGNIETPKRTKDVAPTYPDEAQRAGVQGVVIIEATIGTDGKVVSTRVVRSIPQLDQAAVDAVRQWEFSPTLVNGVPVSVIMTVTVNFSLGSRSPVSSDETLKSQTETAAPECVERLTEATVQTERRQAALRFIQEVNARESTVFIARQGQGYATLDELRGLPTLPEGFETQLSANGPIYAVSVKDKFERCGFALFSDQHRVIYAALPIPAVLAKSFP